MPHYLRVVKAFALVGGVSLAGACFNASERSEDEPSNDDDASLIVADGGTGADADRVSDATQAPDADWGFDAACCVGGPLFPPNLPA
ncbi:MAG: hypothetical protein AAGF12_40355 [Myxococcota bacterium]